MLVYEGNMLASNEVMRAGKQIIRAKPGLLMLPYPSTNFEIRKYYQNEPKLSGVCSRNNLPKIKDGAYVINVDKFKSNR